MDSCASAYMTANSSWIQNIKPCKKISITVANKSIIFAKSVAVKIHTDTVTKEVIAEKGLYVSEAAINLLSVSQKVKHGLTVNFEMNGCEIRTRNSELLATATETNGIYKLDKPNKK
ncbi:hypothetical protein CBL_20619 [Carabus blaptoides fortunei]